MNAKKLVKASNIIGLVAIMLLVYWVFAFILINVFGLKVFRAHISETFALSILGIIALMAGALMLNIMLNLTRIAERDQVSSSSQHHREITIALLAGFPLLAAILFGGNYLTAQKKQRILLHSAEQLIQQYPRQTAALSHYQFTLPYLHQTSDYLRVLARQDTAFSDVSIIVQDQIDGMPVYLHFAAKSHHDVDNKQDTSQWVLANTNSQPDKLVYHNPHDNSFHTIAKADYIFSANVQEREYLQRVFAASSKPNSLEALRFVADNGQYEIFYPYYAGKQTIVFRLSDYQRYGKLGSY